MKQVLGRKQSMKSTDEGKWWEVINHIENYVSRAEVETATIEVLNRILTATTEKKRRMLGAEIRIH